MFHIWKFIHIFPNLMDTEPKFLHLMYTDISKCLTKAMMSDMTRTMRKRLKNKGKKLDTM